MTNEEYERALEKTKDISQSLISIAQRCYIAENARFKVGDFITPPDSTELYEVTDVLVHDFGYEKYEEWCSLIHHTVHDFDILYVLMHETDPDVQKVVRQKELLENHQQ